MKSCTGAFVLHLGHLPWLLAANRAMCHSICWMAPFMIIGERIGFALHVPQLHVEVSPDVCNGCGRCEKACPMSLPVSTLLAKGSIEHPECIQCGVCCDVCRKDACRLTFGNRR